MGSLWLEFCPTDRCGQAGLPKQRAEERDRLAPERAATAVYPGSSRECRECWHHFVSGPTFEHPARLKFRWSEQYICLVTCRCPINPLLTARGGLSAEHRGPWASSLQRIGEHADSNVARSSSGAVPNTSSSWTLLNSTQVVAQGVVTPPSTAKDRCAAGNRTTGRQSQLWKLGVIGCCWCLVRGGGSIPPVVACSAQPTGITGTRAPIERGERVP